MFVNLCATWSGGSGGLKLSRINIRGSPRGKRDGVIRHILERENGNWMEKVA